MTNKHSTNQAIVWVIGLLLIVGIASYALTSGFTKSASFNIGSSPSTSGYSPTSGVPCTSVAQTPQVSVKFPNPTLTPIGQFTLVASQTINAYLQPGGTSIAATATSSSSAPVSLNSLNCGSTYLITAGSSTSSYFLNATTFTLQQGATNPQVTVIAPQYTAPTATFANGTLGATARSFTVWHNVVASGTYSGTLYLQAGQYNDSMGPIAVTFAYNALAGVPSIPGASSVSNPIVPPALSNGQNSYITYLLPAASNFYYNSGLNGLSQSIGSSGIAVQYKTTSAFGAAENTVISAQVTPGTNFFSTYSGTLLPDQFINPQTQATLYTPISYTTAFSANFV